MPSTPYAQLLISVNGDVPAAGARVVTNGDTIAFSFESTVGWPNTPPARIEFYSYPEGWAGPGGAWVSEQTTVGGPNGTTITYTAYVHTSNSAPASFTMPAGPAWGKYLVKLVVNGGVKGGAQHDDMNDYTGGLEILSSTGLHDLAWQEGSQFSTEIWRKWQGDHAANLRTISTAIAASVTSVTGTAPIVSSGGATPAISITPASAGTAGSLSIANFNLLAGATAAATADKIAIRGASGQLTAAWFTAGATSFLSTGVTFDESGTTTITKAAGAGVGAATVIKGADGAVGSAGGNLSIGPGIGGTPDTDAPGTLYFPVGSNGAVSGPSIWTAGSFGPFFVVNYTLATDTVLLGTDMDTIKVDAAVDIEFAIAGAVKATLTATTFNLASGVALQADGTALTTSNILPVATGTDTTEGAEQTVALGTYTLTEGHSYTLLFRTSVLMLTGEINYHEDYVTCSMLTGVVSVGNITHVVACEWINPLVIAPVTNGTSTVHIEGTGLAATNLRWETKTYVVADRTI